MRVVIGLFLINSAIAKGGFLILDFDPITLSLIASALWKSGELAYGKLPALKTKLFTLMGNDEAQNIMATLERDPKSQEDRARLKSCLDRTASEDKTALEKCAKEILDAIQAEIIGKTDVDQELVTIIHNHQNHIYNFDYSRNTKISAENAQYIEQKIVHHHGISLLDYEAGLKRREKEVRQELETANDAQREIHLKELDTLHQKMANIEDSHAQRLTEIENLKTALENLKTNISDNELKSALVALDQGNTDEAKALLESITEKEDEGIKPFAEARFQLGKIAEQEIDYETAFNHYKRAVQFAPDNSLYLNAVGFLSNTLGQYDKAIEYFEKVLTSDLKTFGEDHPNVTTDWNNIGTTWHNLGQYDKAIEYYEKALTSDLKNYDEDHPNVAIDWNNLGSVWDSLGQYDKAIEYYEKALTSDLKTYDEDHPNVAIRWNNLGAAWSNLGQYGKAIEYYEKALTSDLKTYDEDHHNVAVQWNNLGSAWHNLGQYDKAIEYYEKALTSDLKTYDEDHPNVAIRWNNLGLAWNNLGQYDKAIEYYEKALTSDLKTYDEDHPKVATRWNNLGLAWGNLGQYDKAIEYYEKTLVSLRKTFPSGHPYIDMTEGNLAAAREKLGNSE